MKPQGAFCAICLNCVGRAVGCLSLQGARGSSFPARLRKIAGQLVFTVPGVPPFLVFHTYPPYPAFVVWVTDTEQLSVAIWDRRDRGDYSELKRVGVGGRSATLWRSST